MAELIPLNTPLDDTGLTGRYKPASTTQAAMRDDLARYHHPLFVRSEPGLNEDWVKYYFHTFTGLEPQPHLNGDIYRDQTVTREQRRQIEGEYRTAEILWSHARLRRQAAPLLKEAAPLWQAWTAAHDELRSTFRAFWETTDHQWRAQLLRLTDAEASARAAADAFDAVAGKLAKLANDQIQVAGEEHDLPLRTVAQELGLDASDWHIAWIHAYDGSPSWGYGDRLDGDVNREIDEQRKRLREVAELAGDRDLAGSAPA